MPKELLVPNLDVSPPAKIRIHLPPGCTRRSLSIEALDRYTRELAYQTLIEIDGKPIYCLSFQTKERNARGKTLVLEIAPECFEFVEHDDVPDSEISDPRSQISPTIFGQRSVL